MDICNPTEEHALLRDMCRDFTKSEVEGQAAEYDEKECLNVPLFRQLGELGLLGITVPEEWGGSGMDATAAVIAHHEISKSDPGFCLAYLAHSMLFVNNFFYCSNDAQKKKWLDGVITGELIGGMAMTEPGYGTDVLGMTTTAEKRGDVFVMNGTKTFITNGPEGHIFLVYAKVDGRTTAFAVTEDLPGFSKSEHIEKMGMRASSMSELIFEDCEVPAENVLGQVGGGLTHMMRNLEIERLTLAAQSLGIADRCLEMMVHYANERQSFGVPINRHGQIQRYIGESYAKTEAMRALVYNVALSVGPDSRNRLGSDAAKLYAGPVAKEVADNAMQVLGGNGYCREYPIERLLRDAKLIEIGGGTIESHQKNITKDLTKALS